MNLIPADEYASAKEQARKIMPEDIKDVPYVAVYLVLNCNGIWTNDSDFKNKKEIRIYETKDMLCFIDK